jgi:hypothetical protein
MLGVNGVTDQEHAAEARRAQLNWSGRFVDAALEQAFRIDTVPKPSCPAKSAVARLNR